MEEESNMNSMSSSDNAEQKDENGLNNDDENEEKVDIDLDDQIYKNFLKITKTK